MRKFFPVILSVLMLASFYLYASGNVLPTTSTVAVTVKASLQKELPRAKCFKGNTGEGYHRATNDLFAKHGLMVICDEGYGALNVKKIDNVALTSRPKTGPLVIGGCVATVKGYENRASYAGCRVAVTGASEVDGKIILHTAEGDFSL